jgi:hypothetical protein
VDVAAPADGDPLVVAAGQDSRAVRPPRLAGSASIAVRDAEGTGDLTRVHGRTWVSERVLVDGVPRRSG